MEKTAKMRNQPLQGVRKSKAAKLALSRKSGSEYIQSGRQLDSTFRLQSVQQNDFRKLNGNKTCTTSCQYCSRKFRLRHVLLQHERRCPRLLASKVEIENESDNKSETQVPENQSETTQVPENEAETEASENESDAETEQLSDTETEHLEDEDYFQFELPKLCQTDIIPIFPIDPNDPVEPELKNLNLISTYNYTSENNPRAFTIGDIIIEPLCCSSDEQDLNWSKNCGENRHDDLQMDPCGHCGETFPSKTILEFHKFAHGHRDNDSIPLKCRYCPRILVSRQTLEYHERTHTEERRHPCPYCGRCFARSGTLSIHIRQHIGEKPYVCRYCPKTFVRSTVRDIHEFSHWANQPFKCSYCHIGFNDGLIMEAHEKMYCVTATAHHIQTRSAFQNQNLQILRPA